MRVAALSMIGVGFLSLTHGVAQTVTASGGAAGTVPVFSGASTITGSPIAASGSQVNMQQGLVIDEQNADNGAMWFPGQTTGTLGITFGTGTAAGQYSGEGIGSQRTSGAGSNIYGLNLFTAYTNRLAITNNGLIGLGTQTPTAGLDVSNGDGIHIFQGGVTPTVEGAYLGWTNLPTFPPSMQVAADGVTEFVNNPGTGAGGWAFMVAPWASTAPYPAQYPALFIDAYGNINMVTNAHIQFPDSTVQNTAWTGVLCGGDYAESVATSDNRKTYEPGDVMALDPATPGKFIKNATPYSTLVAGIYSTRPGVVGRRTTDQDKAKEEIPMAMVGIVPAKVSAENGAVKVGDLLVTASTPGYVMKGTDRQQMLGAIVGKSMGTLDAGLGIIDVLVSLQ